MNHDRAFADELLRLNEQRLRWLAPMLVALIAANMGLNMRFDAGLQWALQLRNFVWLLAALLLWVVVHYRTRGDWPRGLRQALVLAFAILTLGMGMARFVSYLHFGIVPTYIVCVMGVAMAVLMRPQLFVPMFLAAFTLFGLIVFSQDLPTGTQQMIVRSSGTATLFAMLLSHVLYRSQRAQFDQTLAIKASNERLRQLNDELRRHQRAMNEVMEMTAHDLRSPLFGLRNLLTLGIQRADYGAERLRGVMGAAVEASDDLLALLTRVLEAREAERQQPPPLRRQDLRPLFQAAAQRVAALAEAKGVRVELDLPRRTVERSTHADSLAQVLDNLLSNAVKFSPPGSVVGLKLSEAGAGWWAEVRDQGPGIPPDERGRLFHKFRRGSAIATGGEPCAGMGLFIAQRRAQSLGGTLEYIDRADAGAVFRLDFTADA